MWNCTVNGPFLDQTLANKLSTNIVCQKCNCALYQLICEVANSSSAFRRFGVSVVFTTTRIENSVEMFLKRMMCYYVMSVRGIRTRIEVKARDAITMRDKELTQFAAVCRRPKLVVDRVGDLVSGMRESDVLEPRIRTMVVRDEFGQPSVEAFVLPELKAGSEKLCWPTFTTAAQRCAITPSLFFQKATLATAARVNATLALLKQRNDVGWVGSPGIGKSMATFTLTANVRMRGLSYSLC